MALLERLQYSNSLYICLAKMNLRRSRYDWVECYDRRQSGDSSSFVEPFLTYGNMANIAVVGPASVRYCMPLHIRMSWKNFMLCNCVCGIMNMSGYHEDVCKTSFPVNPLESVGCTAYRHSILRRRSVGGKLYKR